MSRHMHGCVDILHHYTELYLHVLVKKNIKNHPSILDNIHTEFKPANLFANVHVRYIARNCRIQYKMYSCIDILFYFVLLPILNRYILSRCVHFVLTLILLSRLSIVLFIYSIFNLGIQIVVQTFNVLSIHSIICPEYQYYIHSFNILSKLLIFCPNYI